MVNNMKTYSVTFDMKENCTNCVEVNQVSTYIVSAATIANDVADIGFTV